MSDDDKPIVGKTYNICCEDFFLAQQPGTDSEQYACLIQPDDDGNWCIGAKHLGFILFCPWCGSNIEDSIAAAPLKGE